MNQDPFKIQPQGPDIKRLLIAGVLMFIFAVIYGQFFSPKMKVKNTELINSIDLLDTAKEKIDHNLNDVKAPILKNNNINKKIIKSFFINVKKNINIKSSDAIRGGYEISFSNLGGQIDDVKLSGYDEIINLVNSNLDGLKFLSLSSRDSGVTLNADAFYKIIFIDKNEITFEHITPEGIRILRNYKMNSKRFMIDHEIIIKNSSKINKFVALNLHMASKYGKISESGFFSPRSDDEGIVWKVDGKRDRFSFKNLDSEIKKINGEIIYAGFDKQYFLTSLMSNDIMQINSCSSMVIKNGDKKENSTVLLSLAQQGITLKPGDNKSYKYSAFFGPKQLNILQNAGYDLDENINFGWFTVISRPLLWLLVKIFDFVGNFGVAIMLLTLLVKLVTFPLTQKSFISMQKMKKFQPDLKALQKKYSHDRAVLGQKQMELYREKGINPLAGCLPMLLQMPIWFALYQMLWNSVELYQQPFVFWLTNLTAPDSFYILPVAMGISMAVQTAFQPTPQEQPQMKYMMWGMPLFLTFIMLKMPSGLSLYIFVNNVLTIFQQIYIKHRYADK